MAERFQYTTDADGAWELCRKIMLPSTSGGLRMSELKDIFGTYSREEILEMPLNRALLLYNVYFAPQPKYFCVGDEVVVQGRLCVVMSVEVDGKIAGLYLDSETITVFNVETEKCRATGKHYDSVYKLIQELREGKVE